jgi:hypothetical protein
MIERRCWDESLPLLDFPRFKCPVCNSGHFVVNQSTVLTMETAQSVKEYETIGESEEIRCRFMAMSICDNPQCKEPMVLSGVTQNHAVYGQQEDWDVDPDYAGRPIPKYKQNYTITYLSAPITLIDVPKNVDIKLKELLDFAFLSFWSEANTCANKIRQVLEYLLTDVLKISNEGTHEVKCGHHLCPKEIKKKDLTLGHQIDKLLNDEEFGSLRKLFKALKNLGNSGSHVTDNKIIRAELMKAFVVLESILKEIYTDPDEIGKLADEIMQSRKSKPKQ